MSDSSGRAAEKVPATLGGAGGLPALSGGATGLPAPSGGAAELLYRVVTI